VPVEADSRGLWERRLARERAARKQAEQLLEEKSRELWLANQALQKLAEGLERQVEARTAELKDARDRALAASNAKSAFLANMSHEIRTPISGVIGMAELLLDSGLADKQRQQVQVILQSAKSLLTIINDVLCSTSRSWNPGPLNSKSGTSACSTCLTTSSTSSRYRRAGNAWNW